jgi:hypothetical protein
MIMIEEERLKLSRYELSKNDMSSLIRCQLMTRQKRIILHPEDGVIQKF